MAAAGGSSLQALLRTFPGIGNTAVLVDPQVHDNPVRSRAPECSNPEVSREVHMLAEARRAFPKTPPPFVFGRRYGERPPGTRKVVLLANDGIRPRDPSTARRAQLVCRMYDAEYAFWTLDQDEKRYIVKTWGGGHRGSVGYRIWRGPDKGFDQKVAAFSDHFPRGSTDNHENDESAQQDGDSTDDNVDDEDEAFSPDIAQQCSERERHPREVKGKGSSARKDLAVLQHEVEERLRRRRERRRLRRTQLKNAQAPSTSFTHTPTRSRPSHVTPSLSQASEAAAVGASAPTPSRTPAKRERSPSGDLYGQSPGASSRRRSPSIAVIEVVLPPNTSIDFYKQSHTTLHISLSTNDYGAVPIYLRSCMTIETFFASMLSAWGLEGKDSEVAAVTVKFDWLKEEGPMIVRREVSDSFQKMLETINEAQVWKDRSVERRRCDVRVKIILK
ncbi:hypothetical protein MMC16_007484 [Acarospora aff. strigata]|nr:hypothetical protein [Acarospora aff. strigata]